MSCKHLYINDYCTLKHEFCERKLFPRLCKDYCRDDSVEKLKKILNEGPATTTNCACNESTAENDYVSMLEMFINKCYPTENFGLFCMTPQQAETHIDNNMRYLGYNKQMIDKAYYDTITHFADSEYSSCYVRLNNFISRLISQPHKDYPECSTSFRFVLTLILGYLDKLDSVDIMLCQDPKEYFKNKVGVNLLRKPNLSAAVNKTRAYVKESKDSKLAEGMRMVEQWFEEVAKENIPAKELTIADIEKQLGYKIKIVGDDK